MGDRKVGGVMLLSANQGSQGRRGQVVILKYRDRNCDCTLIFPVPESSAIYLAWLVQLNNLFYGILFLDTATGLVRFVENVNRQTTVFEYSAICLAQYWQPKLYLDHSGPIRVTVPLYIPCMTRSAQQPILWDTVAGAMTHFSCHPSSYIYFPINMLYLWLYISLPNWS